MNTNSNKIQTLKQPASLGNFLVGTIFGVMVGAVTVLLTAPQPGAKTRTELQQGLEQFRDRTSENVKERLEQVKSKANQIKTEVQIRADGIRHQGKGMVIKQLDRVSQLADAGKKAILEEGEHIVA